MMIDEWWATPASNNFANERENVAAEALAAGLAAGLERGAKIARERATCTRLLCVHESCMGAREAADEIDGELDAERERTRGG